MRAYTTFFLTRHDHPTVEKTTWDEDGVEEESMTIHLTEDVRIEGSPEDVRRWVEELTVRLALV